MLDWTQQVLLAGVGEAWGLAGGRCRDLAVLEPREGLREGKNVCFWTNSGGQIPRACRGTDQGRVWLLNALGGAREGRMK